MKITALGVNSAFAIGEYNKVIRVKDLEQILDRLPRSLVGKVSLSKLREEIAKETRRMYLPKWQSNFILEFNHGPERPYRLAVDFGSDFRHSLEGAGLTLSDLDGYYCSHPHADHIGGFEGIALSHLFNPYFKPEKAKWLTDNSGKLELVAKRLSGGEQIPHDFKPDLYGHKSVLNELWSAARAGLETIQGVPDVNLQTYFNVMFMEDNKPVRFTDGSRYWDIYTVVSVHVNAGYRQMPSYGLMLKCSDGKIVFMPTDTQFMTPRQVALYYETADVIYQDCETGPRSDVHPHIDDLRTLPAAIKSKCYLYHYSSIPVIDVGEFKGIMTTGESHEY